MPRTADGRPLSYIALNGHGAYPRTGFIPRIFLAFNDYTGKGDMQFQEAKICLAVSGQLVSLPGSSWHSITILAEVMVCLAVVG